MGAAVFGMTAIIVGAIGAHAVEMTEPDARIFQMAVIYQLIHSAVMAVVGIRLVREHSFILKLSGMFFGLGILLFCGTLIVSTMTSREFPTTAAPFGGICLIFGWLMFGVSAFAKPKA